MFSYLPWNLPPRSVSVAPLPAYVKDAMAVLSNQGWQPIETAPKDTDMLVFDPSYYGIVIATFYRLHAVTGRPVWNVAWDRDGDMDIEPSHWMPLPNKPNGKTGLS